MISSALALSACAAPSAVKPDPGVELLAEVRALRADNARLERRLEKLERERAVAFAAQGERTPGENSRASSAKSAGAAAPSAREATEIPPLTVVKLKPRREPAAKIATNIEVQEPAEDTLESLKAQLEADAQTREKDDVIDLSFEKALSSLKTGNVSGGVAALMRLAAEAPRHPRADNALYFAGLGQLGLNNTAEAERLFAQVVDLYPAGDAVQDAMLKLAECRLKLNRPSEARAVYEQVVSEFPGSAAANQAQLRLTRFNATLKAASPVP